MIIKCVEIRDEGTCIAAIAIKMCGADDIESRFLWRCGYPRDGVVLMRLDDQGAHSDPYDWGGANTTRQAHIWLCEHFDEFVHGQVLDVRMIRGDASEPAPAEIWTEGVGS